jgi:dihydrofolate synthase / folylpolyglutamate synthase
MIYGETIEYLYGLQKHGMKFGLGNTKKLMSLLGEPQKSFSSVHVAGTNGKGSTSAMIESILRTKAGTTGLFTSPHLVSFTERIRINGNEISEASVIELAAEVRNAAAEIEDFCPTFFEVVTAMAFLHFRKMGVEWAVIETGMGGRLDATNIILPEVSVLTSIGLDHREFLGGTLREIAGEKAGIIKQGVPVVTAGQEPVVMEVIRARCDEKGSGLYRHGTDFSAKRVSPHAEAVSLDYQGSCSYSGVRLALSGEHQVVNAALAIKAVEVISEKFPAMVFDIRKGLGEMQWPGRLEMVRLTPPVLLDGAHNPHAAGVLSVYLRELLEVKYRRLIMIIGVMADKEIEGILKPLLPLASETIFASPPYGRAATAERLQDIAASMGYASKKADTVAAGLKQAEALFSPGDLIVVTGSFYTIGEAKEVIGYKGVLTGLRE